MANENNYEEVFDLGNGCKFIATRKETIEKIAESEQFLLEKAKSSTDPKYERFNKRIIEDTAFRQRKAVIYVMKAGLDNPEKKEKK